VRRAARRLAGASAVVAALALAAPLARAAEVRDPGCGTLALVQRSGVLVERLGHGFVRPGSDSVWTRAGALARGRDYVIDLLRGDLRLLREPVPGETLWVRTCWLLAPPPLELQLESYRPPRAGADTAGLAPRAGPPASGAMPGRAGAARDPFAAPAGASLALSGNKTVAVDFGSSQDAALRQSLDLTVSGTLAPGVTLTGALSDRNTPLTAAGSTQDLQALDRVLIELRAPHASATLGDLTLAMNDGEFGRLERRLQGARGTFDGGGLAVEGAAASAQGEFRRMEFVAVEGRQGPYPLTDRDGAVGVTVVAGSEVVSLDGQRLTRGESADYAIDYEQGRLTFTNRRPITGQSRVTVEYQYAVNRYRRNLVAGGGRFTRGRAWVAARVFSEGDDSGRPLDLTFDAADRVALAAAGDSAGRAIAGGVSGGGGDYDSVRVAGELRYAFAGPDSGAFDVSFARVGSGRGDYADSASVDGRTVFRWVGPGLGAYVIGRALPLPETHRLFTTGAGARFGALTIEAEGAHSVFDRNTLSALDDRDDGGDAGRLALQLAGRLRGPLAGEGALSVRARSVGRGFEPFTRLERAFAQEEWGLPAGVDLERQDRWDVEGTHKGVTGITARGWVGRLRTLDGARALRRGTEWSREGALAARALWERSESTREGWRFGDGGRDHLRGELRWRGAWVEPAVRGESDARRAPSDSGRAGQRFREGAFELASPRRLAWRARASLALRRDGVAAAAGFADQTRARTWSGALESPGQRAFGVTLQLQRRDLLPLAGGARTRSDLGSLRLRGQDAKRGARGTLSIEITSEGESRRSRVVQYVGAGAGAYDALGNFVGTGDYTLVVAVTDALDRVARAATQSTLGWDFGASERWRGSRVEFVFDAEARRRGALRASDLFVSPGAARGDPGFARASVSQRLEAELAPGSRAAAVRVRLERRVQSDRQYVDFGQSTEDRQGSARWRARPGAIVTTELEARVRRQSAEQRASSGASYTRTLAEGGGTGQLVVTPVPALRLSASGEASWSRPAGQTEPTRTLRAGTGVGLALGARGRAELGARRAFLSGPPAVGLLPSADPAGAARWEANARVDYRLRASTTVGMAFSSREYPGRRARYDGRAEVRAFF
jgi:hypothetical protein